MFVKVSDAVRNSLVAFSSTDDPAHGSSVLLTFITDAMGFFLFLGLATAFLR